MTTREKYDYLINYTKHSGSFGFMAWCKREGVLKHFEYDRLFLIYTNYMASDEHITRDSNGILLVNLLYEIVNNYSKNNSK